MFEVSIFLLNAFDIFVLRYSYVIEILDFFLFVKVHRLQSGYLCLVIIDFGFVRLNP